MTWQRQLIGIPFCDRGRDEAGLDCGGLVIFAYRKFLGRELPDRPDLSALDHEGAEQAAKNLVREPAWTWLAAGLEVPFDLAVIWRIYRRNDGALRFGPIHCGLVSRPGTLIHCDPPTGTVEAEYRPQPHFTLATRRIEFFRHAEMVA